MIQLPQRSVTRFFIPLIDVLTLLFCIFLVLPLATTETNQSGDASAEAATPDELLPEKVEQLRQLERQLRDEIDKLRSEKSKALQQRLSVRVLEIDGDTGKLYYRDPERVPIADEAAAHALIERDRRKLGQKELYYLILYPRNRGSSYPTVGQREKYDRWFMGVAVGYDIPGAAGGGEQP
ncbi:MAG: hypothetical protein ACYC3I_21775 [Gemmataceae bacterium]